MVENATITVSFVDANGQAVEYQMTAKKLDLNIDAGVDFDGRDGFWYPKYKRNPYRDAWSLTASGNGKDAITCTVKASA